MTDHHTFTWSAQPNLHSAVGDHFANELATGRFEVPHVLMHSQETSGLPPHVEGWKCRIVMNHADADEHELWESDDALIFYNLDARAGKLMVTVAAGSMDDAKSTLGRIVGTIPPPEETPDTQAKIHFWNHSRNGPRAYLRSIDVPPYERRNYSHKLRGKLADMVEWKAPPTESGRLILFHGDAGTGKTSAIRSLCASWKSWADIHYIVDPERFFSETDYLMQVMLYEKSQTPSYLYEDEDDEYPANNENWHIIVIEDAGEMLMADAKDQVGQALSRLLNLADGMIGQGMKVLILITTNEPIGELHPAIVRAGRCLANLSFPKLNAREATEWCGKPHGPATLADLYAEGREQKQLSIEEDVSGNGSYI